MSEHSGPKFIEDFDAETILTAAMDVFDNVLVVKDNVPELERKIEELGIANNDLTQRMRSLVSGNKQITKLLRSTVPEELAEDAAGSADLVRVLIAWTAGTALRLEAKEKALDEAESEIKRFRRWHDDFTEQLGTGIHTMFRKWTSHENGHKIWELISQMGIEWFDAVEALAKAFHDGDDMRDLLEDEQEDDE